MTKCVECGNKHCDDIDGACFFCNHEMLVRCRQCVADFCKYCVAHGSDTEELEEGELPDIEVSSEDEPDEYDPVKRPRRQAAVKANKFIKLVSAAVALAGGFKDDPDDTDTEPMSEEDDDSISTEVSDNDEPVTQEEEESEDEVGSTESDEEEEEYEDDEEDAE